MMESSCIMAGRKPCNTCRLTACGGTDCPRWQGWFLESWAAVHRYAWAARDEMGREEPLHFQYELPHLCKSPCSGCPCESWCDVPCSLRIKWWDARMGRLRRRMGDGYAR